MPPVRRIGPYELVRPLGQGGMGAVFEVRQEGLSRPLALKLLARGEVDARALERFRREGQALARVRHPGVVTVHVAEDSTHGPYLVTDLVPGEDLERWLERAGPPTPRRAVEIARDLAAAVEAVHEAGLLHRDIKPANVILTPEGRPVLVDFGLARIADAQRLTRTGAVLGTPALMAPEQALGTPADARTDVWGLGVVLVRLLGGELCSGSYELPALERGLRAVCAKALHPRPGGRYGAASVLREDLERWLGGERPLADRGGLGPVRLAAALLGASGLLAAAFLASAGPARPRAGPQLVAGLGSDAQVSAAGAALGAALARPLPAARRDALRAWLREHPAHREAPRARAALRACLWEVPAWTWAPPGRRGPQALRGLWLDEATALFEARQGPSVRLERWRLPLEPGAAPRLLERWEAPPGTLVDLVAYQGGPALVLAGTGQRGPAKQREPAKQRTQPHWLELRDLSRGLPGALLRRRHLDGPPTRLAGARGAPLVMLSDQVGAGVEEVRWNEAEHPEMDGGVLLGDRGAKLAAWSSSGARLALVTGQRVGGAVQSVSVWQLGPPKLLLERHQERRATALAFVPGREDQVVAASHAGDVLVHTLDGKDALALRADVPGREFERLAHRLPVVGLTFAGGVLISAAGGEAGQGGELRRWDLATWRELPPAVLDPERPCTSLEASPAGRRLLVGVPDGVELRWVPE